MDTFDTNSEEISVENIMKKIRENIQKKGIETFPMELDEILKDSAVKEFYNGSNIRKDLEYIDSSWDIQNNDYLISSHRPVVGEFLVKGRQLVNGEVKRYIDPAIQKQIIFNESVVNILNNMVSSISSLDNRIERVKQVIDYKVGQLKPEIDSKIEQMKSDTDHRIMMQTDAIISSINSDLEKKSWLANLLDNKINSQISNLEVKTSEDRDLKSSKDEDLNLNYFVFEERFRGPREEIKQRQLKYLDYFKGCKNVLDIGCGRGEFLELLQENEIKAQGLDIDVNMVNFARSKGLTVNMMDAVSFLEDLEDNSLDGIFINQVVEHLEPAYLIKMLNLCYQKLMYGYFIIIETVNPLSLVSFVNFYIDLSHIKPLHPETVRFLLEVAGFREIELKFYSPVKDETRLQKAQLHQDMREGEKSLIETFNRNVDILNNQLYGPQDYAFFGKK